MTAHVLPAHVFDELARGDGSLLGPLQAAQRSRRLLLLHGVVTEMHRLAPRLHRTADAATSLAAIAAAHRRARDEVDAVLLSPHVGAWISACLRGLRSDRGPEPADVGHLGLVAVAAALRAGSDVDVMAYVGAKSLTLPTFGRLDLPRVPGWSRVRRTSGPGGDVLWVGDDAAPVPVASGEPSRWQPLRRLRSSAGDLRLRVVIDDVGAYRDCGHLEVADRLDDDAVGGWREALHGGWCLLASSDRALARAVADTVTTIVPLQDVARASASATCRGALGAVAMTRPRDPITAACTLVHEAQHTKLYALMDLVALTGPGGRDAPTHYSPWRPDPRPVEGLLHGAYAYLGLLQFWEAHHSRTRRRRNRDRLTGYELALGLAQLPVALEELAASDQLTPAGRRFVSGMARRLAGFDARSLPGRLRAMAALAAADHASSWRLRNMRPDASVVAQWADEWHGDRHPRRSCDTAPVTVIDGAGPLGCQARHSLIRRLATGQSEGAPGDQPGEGDRLLLVGRFAAAADRYRRQVVDDPHDLASWTGLAVAHARNRSSPPAWTRPELVFALHRHVVAGTGTSADPDALARWLSHAPD